ncbi:11163_t:CDS:2 [Ambispora gerdemannii]|uniref:11163_t:CDS:1 n=1 Tax=Ambispora gerdemannii TaxID=144530 RepID=A0A9N9H339_9GLOM|nr:11163_t:CDS:2 [Ambispora gerdemannii]
MEKLKKKVQSLGLWNLFLSKDYPEGTNLSNCSEQIQISIRNDRTTNIEASIQRFWDQVIHVAFGGEKI